MAPENCNTYVSEKDFTKVNSEFSKKVKETFYAKSVKNSPISTSSTCHLWI